MTVTKKYANFGKNGVVPPKLKERFYWPGQYNDVHDWCRTCTTCASRKTPTPKPRAPLQSVQTGFPCN